MGVSINNAKYCLLVRLIIEDKPCTGTQCSLDIVEFFNICQKCGVINSRTFGLIIL